MATKPSFSVHITFDGTTGTIEGLLMDTEASVRNVKVKLVPGKVGRYEVTFFTNHNIRDDRKPFIWVFLIQDCPSPLLIPVICSNEVEILFFPENNVYQYQYKITLEATPIVPGIHKAPKTVSLGIRAENQSIIPSGSPIGDDYVVIDVPKPRVHYYASSSSD